MSKALPGVLLVLLGNLLYHNASAQPHSECNSALALKKILDEKHIDSEALSESWSARVLFGFIQRLDPQGLIFLEEDFFDSSGVYFDLVHVVETNACDFTSLMNKRFEERLIETDILLASLDLNADVFPKNIGLGRIENIQDYPFEQAERKSRLAVRIKEDLLTAMFLENNHAQVDERAVFNEAIEKLRCVISKKISRVKTSDDFVMQSFLKAIARAYDPHTNYFDLSLYELIKLFSSEDEASLGIKVIENEQGEIIVDKLLPGGPAWRSNKVFPGDVIQSIIFSDEKEIDFSCTTLDAARSSLSKREAQKVTVVVKRGFQNTSSVELVMEMVAPTENAVRGYVLKGEKKIGYIALPGFYTTEGDDETERGCARDVSREIIKLKREKIEGLILDLRNNRGGSVHEALELLGIFIEDGPLILLEKEGEVRVFRDRNPGSIYDGPLVLLVNNQSASASELVAATLQDYNRALIVGDTTFGKAVGQIYQRVGSYFKEKEEKVDPGLLNITNTRIYRLNGDSYQQVGIWPDIYIPSLNGLDLKNEANYPFAMSGFQIDRETYFKAMPDFPLTKLRSANQQRFASKGYDKIFTTQDSILLATKLALINLNDTSYRALATLESKKIELLSSSKLRKPPYSASNHKMDAMVLSIDAQKYTVEQVNLKIIQDNLYIRISYEILSNLIEHLNNN